MFDFQGDKRLYRIVDKVLRIIQLGENCYNDHILQKNTTTFAWLTFVTESAG